MQRLDVLLKLLNDIMPFITCFFLCKQEGVVLHCCSKTYLRSTPAKIYTRTMFVKFHEAHFDSGRQLRERCMCQAILTVIRGRSGARWYMRYMLWMITSPASVAYTNTWACLKGCPQYNNTPVDCTCGIFCRKHFSYSRHV